MPDLEKLTINLTPVDLGQIELLVEQGFYSNRAEFIRIAIRQELSKHSEPVREITARQSFTLGAVVFTRRALQKIRDAGERIAVNVIGLLSIADDVPPELARAVIESAKVRGIFRASPRVKEALADRMN